MQEGNEIWLENRKGMIWYRRYLMLNGMNTSLMLIVYIFFLYVLTGSLGSPGDLPDYAIIIIILSITAIIMVVVLSVWLRIVILRRYLPLKVGIGMKHMAWKSATKETAIPWGNLSRSEPVKFEKGKIEEGIASLLLRQTMVSGQSKSTGSAFHRWVFKRLLVDESVIDGIKEGYERFLLSKG